LWSLKWLEEEMGLDSNQAMIGHLSIEPNTNCVTVTLIVPDDFPDDRELKIPSITQVGEALRHPESFTVEKKVVVAVK
jgi:hypothetical protein